MTRVFTYGPNGEVIGWIYVDEAIKLAKETDNNLHIDTLKMHARITKPGDPTSVPALVQ